MEERIQDETEESNRRIQQIQNEANQARGYIEQLQREKQEQADSANWARLEAERTQPAPERGEPSSYRTASEGKPGAGGHSQQGETGCREGHQNRR